MSKNKEKRDAWRQRNADAAVALGMLMQKYPMAFYPKDSTDTKPLQVGIRATIVEQNPDTSWQAISDALRIYCGKTRYQRALVQCDKRVNLDGTAAGEVSESQRARALAELVQRQSKTLKAA